jgi:hypothetical protein
LQRELDAAAPVVLEHRHVGAACGVDDRVRVPETRFGVS